MKRLILSLVALMLTAGVCEAQTVKAESYKAERIALFVTAATDITTTRMAIRNGGYEGNPLMVKMVGKQPSTLKLVAVKAAAMGIAEWSASVLRKQGKHGQARAAYWIMAISWVLASGFNLQWAWK